MKILETDIKNKNLQSCYLLYGGESFVRETWVTRFKKVVSGPFEDMNIDVFDGAADMNAVMDASQTLPFMSDKRLIIIKDSGLFKSAKRRLKCLKIFRKAPVLFLLRKKQTKDLHFLKLL